jgi:DNA-binding PucR family transcriptional regulator
LVETLERYLDFGCDAQRTAADLGLHRTSLYQRLEKIHDIAFVDLRDGEQRLALHLSLKLARLAELPLDN